MWCTVNNWAFILTTELELSSWRYGQGWNWFDKTKIFNGFILKKNFKPQKLKFYILKVFVICCAIFSTNQI